MALNDRVVLRLGLMIAAAVCSCQDSSSGVGVETALQVPSPNPEASASLASRPLSLHCDKERREESEEAFVKAHGVGMADFISTVIGDYETTLGWSSLTSSLPTPRSGKEAATVYIEPEVQKAVMFPGCNNVVELPVLARLNLATGAPVIEGRGILSAYGPGTAHVVADVALDALSDLSDEVRSAMNVVPRKYVLEIRTEDRDVRGQLSVRGPGASQCYVATWPDARVCKLSEEAIDWNAPFLEMNKDIVEGKLAAELKSREIRWEDSGQVTGMHVEFSAAGGTACLLRSARKGNVAYAIPGTLHVWTDDTRVDMILSGRASVSWQGDEWTGVGLSSEGLAVPNSIAALRDVQLDSTRQVVVALSPRSEHMSRATGQSRLLGGLEVYTLDTQVPGLVPAGAGCMANNFVGALLEVTHTSYL